MKEVLKDISFCSNILFCRRSCVSVVAVYWERESRVLYSKYLQVFLFAVFSTTPHTFVFIAVDGRLRSTSSVWNANLHSSTQWRADQRFVPRNLLPAFFLLFAANANIVSFFFLVYLVGIFVNFSCCFVHLPSLRLISSQPDVYTLQVELH